MKEAYKLTFGLQYEEWEIHMEVPDREMFVSQKQAEETVEKADAVCFLTEKGIYFLYGKTVYEILGTENIQCEFYQMKPELFERLGPPLSPEDIAQLIREDRLEETIFSSRYMITENDFEKRTCLYDGFTMKFYRNILRWDFLICRNTRRNKGNLVIFLRVYGIRWKGVKRWK